MDNTAKLAVGCLAAGYIVGSLLALFLATHHHYPTQEKCEAELKRSSNCKVVFVR